ncbi:hypothetical protein [Pontiella sulfatireligans]|uniref:Uncharacterized protein n=1 Tax=Pontiella sulfatireligans TaxID=2750658 RepID=A0A6C2UPZ5_9BACT|nr:hypothetical protein [Pontiella sulfatireligans]VGO22278.1 hypothetical protein SCARR_04360 [Pontiella sulfatireligans]
MISVQQQGFGPGINIADYEEILFLLRVAREHSQFSIRESGKNEKDEQFAKFINMLAGNVKAILSMLNLKDMVERSTGSSFSFLGANQASVALQAEEYQRRASDIVRSIQSTLRLAEAPFEQLKAENTSAASKEELARYNKARDHFAQLIKENKHCSPIDPSARKFAHV